MMFVFQGLHPTLKKVPHWGSAMPTPLQSRLLKKHEYMEPWERPV